MTQETGEEDVIEPFQYLFSHSGTWVGFRSLNMVFTTGGTWWGWLPSDDGDIYSPGGRYLASIVGDDRLLRWHQGEPRAAQPQRPTMPELPSKPSRPSTREPLAMPSGADDVTHN